MILRTVPHAGWDELVLTVPAQLGETVHDVLMRTVSALHRNDAELVRATVFSRIGPDTAPLQRPRGMPVTFVGGSPCGEGDVAGVQAVGVRGGQLHTYEAGNGAVVTVVEGDDARWAYVTGIEPVSLWAPPAVQAQEAFERAEAALALAGMPFTSVYRTWLFVESILSWYGDLNRVRTGFYESRGVFDHLVPASTGIGVSNPAGAALVLDLVAVVPLDDAVVVRAVESPLQCSAQQYGSSFSRAVEVVEKGVRRVLVSGTASIGPDGQTLHVGDVRAQTEQTLDVIEAILQSRGMAWGNMQRGIVYVREAADGDVVRECLEARGVPDPLLVAAECVICRQNLLVEVELDAAEVIG